MGLGETPKFPVRGHGDAWNQGVIADATVEFRGSGLVATAYGFPGLSATYVATGIVDLRFPQVANLGMRILPNALGPETRGPTGALIGPQGSGFGVTTPGFGVHMSHVNGPSGSALLNITSPLINPSGAVGPTGARGMPAPTGAQVNLLFLAAPIRRY